MVTEVGSVGLATTITNFIRRFGNQAGSLTNHITPLVTVPAAIYIILQHLLAGVVKSHLAARPGAARERDWLDYPRRFLKLTRYRSVSRLLYQTSCQQLTRMARPIWHSSTTRCCLGVCFMQLSRWRSKREGQGSACCSLPHSVVEGD